MRRAAAALLALWPAWAGANPLRTEILLDAAPVAVEPAGREVVLRFAAPLGAADAAALARAAQAGASPLLAGLVLEGDRARLGLARPAAARLEARPGGTALVIEPVAAASLSERMAAAERLAALRAAEVQEARARLEALRADPPPPPPAPRPLHLPGPAEPAAMAPLALDYRRALSADIAAPTQPPAGGTALLAEGFMAAGAGARMWGTLLSGAAEPLPGWRVAFAAEGRGAEAAGGFPARMAARGEFSLSHTWNGAAATRLTLLGGPAAAGAALEHAQRLGPATLRAGGAWNAPWWDTPLGLRRDAVRDGAEAALDWAGPAGLSARLGGGWARYGLSGGRTAAEGPVWRAGLAWAPPEAALPWGLRPRLAYRLDAENLGTAAPWLDARRREIHTVEAGLARGLGPLQAEAVAGWAWDRHGGSGPVARLRLAGGEGPWRAGLEAGVAPSLATAARPVWRGGGFVAWSFGP
ncbi:hypothetical protein ACI6QG_16465 [Roseococcus sp. DSY-14]|uniref:hypothetical protein n=1 Tax=Roseococcus sp. DSY-14 TaxID=3369650 RepID=UPI00387AF089